MGSSEMKVERPVKSGAYTGAAWLSSARVVRCWVKSRNERNHHPMLQRYLAVRLDACTLRRLPGITRRKVEMTSSQYGLYALGDTRVTMGKTEGCQPARGS